MQHGEYFVVVRIMENVTPSFSGSWCSLSSVLKLRWCSVFASGEACRESFQTPSAKTNQRNPEWINSWRDSNAICRLETYNAIEKATIEWSISSVNVERYEFQMQAFSFEVQPLTHTEKRQREKTSVCIDCSVYCVSFGANNYKLHGIWEEPINHWFQYSLRRRRSQN